MSSVPREFEFLIHDKMQSMALNTAAKAKVDEVSALLMDVQSCIDCEVEKHKARYNYLQNYLYFNHYPLFSFAHSVLFLCKEGKSIAASVILRSLVEAHININYHQKGDWKLKLAISAKTGMLNKLRIIDELLSLINKYPIFESKDRTHLLNREGLESKKLQFQRDIRAIEKGNKITDKNNDINLEQKAMKCDVGLTGKEIGAFEYLYRLAYRYLSPSTHLDMQGLEYFVSKNTNGKFIFSEDGNEGLHIGQAIDIYLAFVRDLVEQKVIERLPDNYTALETSTGGLVKSLL